MDKSEITNINQEQQADSSAKEPKKKRILLKIVTATVILLTLAGLVLGIYTCNDSCHNYPDTGEITQEDFTVIQDVSPDNPASIIPQGTFPYESLKLEPQDGDSPYIRYKYSKDNVFIDNEFFSMTIPSGTLYIADLEDSIIEYISWAEQATGLTINPTGQNKLFIQCGDFQTGAWEDIMYLHSQFLLGSAWDEWTIVHECIHMLEGYTANIYHPFFTEGFGQYLIMEIAEQQNNESLLYTSLYRNRSTLWEDFAKLLENNDLEKMLRRGGQLSEYDNYSFTYMGGYQFARYLSERYDSGIYKRIVEANRYSNNVDDYVDTIKNATSDSVFTDFTSWFFDNKQAFDNDLYVFLDYVIGDEVLHRPPGMLLSEVSSGFHPSFSIKFSINEEMIIDLRDIITIADSFGITVDTVSGYIEALIGNIGFAVSAYRQDGTLIGTKELSHSLDLDSYDATNGFSFPSAAILVFHGTGTGILRIQTGN